MGDRSGEFPNRLSADSKTTTRLSFGEVDLSCCSLDIGGSAGQLSYITSGGKSFCIG